MPKRSMGAICVALTVIICLSGCDTNAFQGPLAIQRDGDKLRIAVCVTRTIESGYAEERNDSENKPWARFWEANGEATLTRGQSFSTSESIDGFANVLSVDPELAPGSKLAITLVAADSDGNLSADFSSGGQERLSETTWLHPDGRETTEPCAGY
jgi:hypothetical protein